MTRDEALAILAGGEFDGFVGVTEGLEVEFKREPYRMAQDSQKFELAKDVSALTNAAGGVIVIGVLAERGDEMALDVVTEVPLVARGAVDEQQYEGIVSDRVYPRLTELHVRFYPSQADGERGLVAIDVPPQQESDRYFLIQRPIGGDVDRTPGWLVGLAVRSIGRVEHRRVGEIHTLINRGLGVGGHPARRNRGTTADRRAEARQLPLLKQGMSTEWAVAMPGAAHSLCYAGERECVRGWGRPR